MKHSQSIFQSSSREEFVQEANKGVMRTTWKNGSSFSPKQLVNVAISRVRHLRRHRLNNTVKSKQSVENCFASELLSDSAQAIIGKVLMSSINHSETLREERKTLNRPSSKTKCCASGDDDLSDLSLSSGEDESSDLFKNSSLEYVWILGMQFVVFDSAITTTH